MTNKLFIYGTLAPGQPNEHILKKLGGSWQQAWVNGHLQQGGWGSALGYPGIILDKHTDRVEGFLFISDRLAEFWPELDEFEGDAYERVLTRVEVKSNTSTDAYIYTLKPTQSS